MKLQQLKYFNALCRLKSFSKVASTFKVSQPTVSYAIKSLEEESADYVVLPPLKPKEREVFEQVKAYLEQYGNIGNQQAQELTGLSAATVRRYLSLFVKVGLLTSNGSTKGKLYSLGST